MVLAGVKGGGSGAEANEKFKSFNLSQLITFESRLPASILAIASPENRKKLPKQEFDYINKRIYLLLHSNKTVVTIDYTIDCVLVLPRKLSHDFFDNSVAIVTLNCIEANTIIQTIVGESCTS
jgi:hypothetical protein